MKKKYLIGGIVAAAALGILLFILFNSGTPYAITLNDLSSKSSDYYGKKIRVEGYVAADTIDWTTREYDLIFVLKNEDKQITVFYKGEKQDPSKFIGGIKLLVEGKYNQDGSLAATSIIMECPSEYQDK